MAKKDNTPKKKRVVEAIQIQQKTMRREKIIAGCLIGALFMLAVAVSNDYGLGWDEPPDLGFAERNVRYAFSLNPDWMKFDSIHMDFSIKGRHPHLQPRIIPYHTLNFGNFLSALSCYIFFEKLDVLGSIEAHHLPNKILFALALLAAYKLVRRNYDFQTAIAAIIAIALQPQFFAHMQFNLKDFPYACFMAITILSIRVAVLKYDWKRMVSSAVLLGLAGATKPNAAMIPPIVLIWYFFARPSIRKTETKNKRRFWMAVAASPFISAATYVAVWPFLWTDTYRNFGMFLNYYLNHAAQGNPNFQFDRLYLFLSLQPPAVLVFGCVGIALSVYEIAKNVKRELNILLLLWFVLPVIRVALPKANDYDGVRHYLEYAVPLGIYVGIGFIYFLRRIREFLSARIGKPIPILAPALIAALLPIQWVYVLISTHPNEIAYYNFLVGGTKGAQKRWEDATDYWGASYRQGTNWLNEHAENGAIVLVPLSAHIVGATQSMWMRDDLILLFRDSEKMPAPTKELIGYLRQHIERPLYVMYITRRSWYPPFVPVLEKNAQPVHQITLDGAPLVKIYKIDQNDLKTMKALNLTSGF